MTSIAKCPAAAAYIKAKDFSRSSDFDKHVAGRRAMARILNGDDHEEVIADMESERKAAVQRNIWN